MIEQLQLPTFKGRQVAGTQLKLGGTISCAEDQTTREFRHGEQVVLICVADVTGIRVTSDAEDQLTWTNEFKVSTAYELDDDIAKPILEDLREQVATALDEIVGRSKLPLDEA